MGSVSARIPANPIRLISTNSQRPRVEENVTIIVACIPTLQPLYIAIVKKLACLTGNHNPSKYWHRARSYAAALKRKGTFGHTSNAHDADPEAGTSVEMTTYISSDRQKKNNGSGKGLVSNAAMPGITAETDIRISRADVPK